MNGIKNDVKEFWNNKPCGTFGKVERNPGREYFLEIKERRYQLEPFIKKLIPAGELKGKKVLEIGCGIGTDGIEIASRGADYTGMDISDVSLGLAKANFELNGIRGNLTAGDGERLPFADNEFDFIYSWGVLHHTPDILGALGEVYRVLKPGGKILVMLYNRRSLVGLQLYLLYGLLRFKPFATFAALFANHHESPGTKALTDKEARELFREFANLRIRNFVTPYDMRLARNIYLPSFMRFFIPRRFGFFKVMEGEKK